MNAARSRKLRYVLSGALAAAAMDALLFALSRAAGGLGPSVIARGAGAPLSLGPVVTASAMGVFGAIFARFVIGRVFARSRARRLFLAASGVLLLLSFGSPPTGLEGASGGDILVLELMHVVTFVVGVLTAEWVARPEWRFGASPYHEPALDHRTALVTGATSGIGAEVALELSRRGFQVVGIGRSEKKARSVEREAGTSSGSLRILVGDLSSMREARRLALEANDLVGKSGFSRIVHCAGTLAPSSAATEEGIDRNFATSFLGRLALGREIRLTDDACMVNVAAAESGTLPGFLRHGLHVPQDIGSGMRSHGQAQVANDLWTASAVRAGMRAFGYGPGAVDTSIRREIPWILRALIGPFYWVDTRTASEAASDIVRLLLDVDLPQGGFASRDGLFAHDAWILDETRQASLLALADQLIRSALPRKEVTSGGRGHPR
jgi:NAD(P)-dependent dehydrogenase (short-subunit alcohol dehydrogenase family)